MNTKEALNHSATEEPLSPIGKITVIVLLLIYFSFITIWISKTGPFRSVIIQRFRPLLTPFLVYQSWANPIPRTVNYHETAVIRFNDGSLKLYEFPRLDKLNFFARLRSEKYSTIFQHCMPWPAYIDFLPDFARFIARANSDPKNQPTMINLIHNWCYTPPAESDHWVRQDRLPEHTNQTTYFIYTCGAKDSQ
jgi:hypothetical protein